MNFRHWMYLLIGIMYFYGVYEFWGIDSVKEMLSHYGIPTQLINYISAIAAFFVVFGLRTVMETLVYTFVKFLFKNTKLRFDDDILDIFTKSFRPLTYIIAFYASTLFLTLPFDARDILNKLLSVSLIVMSLIFVTELIRYIFKKKILKNPNLSQENKAVIPIVYRSIIGIIWVFGGISILSNLGYNVSALLAGAGIGGIAIALAAQNSVTNIFGVITIMVNKPFQIGDYITLAGYKGTVTDIHLSYITLEGEQGQTIMIPNSTILSNSVENDTRRNYRRTDFVLGLDYNTSQEKLQEAIQAVKDILHSYVDEGMLQKYRVNFGDFGEYALNINGTYFSNTTDYTHSLAEKAEINDKIRETFLKKKISLAFPTREIYIKNDQDENFSSKSQKTSSKK